MPVILDPVAVAAIGVGLSTLTNVEQEVMRRTGPFEEMRVTDSPTVPVTPTTVASDDLQSISGEGGYVGMWLLRRTATSEGDRARRIVDWQAAAGYLSVDRSYAVPPAPGELFEVCHLHPVQIIRPAVLAGLRRCRFEDRLSVRLAVIDPDGTVHGAPAAERDLTALFPWLTERSQILSVSYREVPTPPVVDLSLVAPWPALWHKTWHQGGHLWISVSPDPFPQNLFLTVDRPADTLVNGVDSLTGPTADTDVLPVTVEYGAAAGHIECWRIAKALLQSAARPGFATTQTEAASVFSQLHRSRRGRQRVGEVRLSHPFWAFRHA